MDGSEFARFAYLGLLLVAVGGWVIASSRGGLGRIFQHFAVWAFLFLGTIAAFGLWNDIRHEVAPRAAVMGGRVEIPRGMDGHYTLTLELNGVPVNFVVDTGATDIVLSLKDAEKIGITRDSLAFTGQALTANGPVRTARVKIPEIGIGTIRDTNVAASVTEGEMRDSLLGMAYLQRFSRIEIASGKMILER